MDKLKLEIDEVHGKHAERTIDESVAEIDRGRRDKALLILGGIGAIDGLTVALSTQVMRALETIQLQKAYEALGFENFAEFLDGHPNSPMTKHQYYERKKILDSEGDIVFDLLNGLKLPLRTRKLLGKGNIQLAGETVIIIDGDQETTIKLNDRTRILETLTAIADQNSNLTEKVEKQNERLVKGEEHVERLRKDVERIRAEKIVADQTPHTVALTNLVFAFNSLIEKAGELSEIEREKFAPGVFEKIAELREVLSVAYKRGAEKKKNGEIPMPNDGEFGADFNEKELAEMMGK